MEKAETLNLRKKVQFWGQTTNKLGHILAAPLFRCYASSHSMAVEDFPPVNLDSNKATRMLLVFVFPFHGGNLERELNTLTSYIFKAQMTTQYRHVIASFCSC